MILCYDCIRSVETSCIYICISHQGVDHDATYIYIHHVLLIYIYIVPVNAIVSIQKNPTKPCSPRPFPRFNARILQILCCTWKYWTLWTWLALITSIHPPKMLFSMRSINYIRWVRSNACIWCLWNPGRSKQSASYERHYIYTYDWTKRWKMSDHWPNQIIAFHFRIADEMVSTGPCHIGIERERERKWLVFPSSVFLSFVVICFVVWSKESADRNDTWPISSNQIKRYIVLHLCMYVCMYPSIFIYHSI